MSVLTFGELLLRLSPPGEERLLESPVLHTNFGGAEANVAVALRHLGVPSSYITRLPDGPLGDSGVEALRREGVAVDRVIRGGSRLGLYFVEPGADLRAMRVVYDRAGSAFSQITPADLDWPAALAGARGLHGTGITPALGEGPAAALTAGYAAATRTLARSARHVVQVVDRVGGGDSFSAGLVAALLAEQSPQDAAEFATAAGALKLGQAGDFGRSTAADVSRLVFEGQHSKE